MSIHDEPTLLQIKQKLGGSVKLRSNARAFRYRLHHKKGMIEVLNKINGYCRNSVRILQLQKLCLEMQIEYISPINLTIHSSWFSGFFDGDGTISYCYKKGYPQLVISVSNKKEIDCLPFKRMFGGFIRLDSYSNTHKWEIFRKEEIMFFCNYLKNHPLHSHKKQRVFLVPKFFELREMGAFKKPEESLTYKTWLIFEKKWFSVP
uniref:Putative LAGLIDADG homing endonuclease n=1 Tax=Jenufa minuta TaxID=993092 RepID=A0A0S2LNP7_JENMI|nr:putative LAGLIDADG homing endonuclease [Jenufa minuta]ALO63007.1 putative LAGLIDADG homing endonuclease [Jenufa minuta]